MGASRYNYHKKTYGNGRVNRMTKDIDKKGMTYKDALYKEQKRLYRRRATAALAVIGGLSLASLDASVGGSIHRSIINSGRKFVDNNFVKSMILDSNGNVIKRNYFKSLGGIVKPGRLRA